MCSSDLSKVHAGETGASLKRRSEAELDPDQMALIGGRRRMAPPVVIHHLPGSPAVTVNCRLSRIVRREHLVKIVRWASAVRSGRTALNRTSRIR